MMAQVKTVSWAPGAHFKADVNKVHDELCSIEKKLGTIDSEIIYETAKDTSLEIHKAVFNCSEGEASRRYFLTNAHRLIASIRVTYEERPDIVVRAFLPVAQKEESRTARIYKSADEAYQDESGREFLLRTARADLERFVRKYENLTELEPALSVIKKILEEPQEPKDKKGKTRARKGTK